MVELKQFYEFGNFRLDVTNKVLERDGINMSITRKMFETLNVLVENADRLVEKDELMRKIWHDRFVEESNLTFNIKMIRKALGDSATSPTYIETVPRRGYRFIAEVREFAERKEIAPAVLPKKTVPIFRHSYLFAAVLIIVLISSLGFASWLWQKNSSHIFAPILSAEFSSTKLSDTGKVHSAVISSHGKYVAYTNQANGKESLWLRHLETANNTQIIPPSDELYFGLAFSKDGETLFFTKQISKEISFLGIYRIPVFGGVPTKVAENTQGWISISPDDKQISFIRDAQSPQYSNKLMVIDVDGKNERELKVSESPNGFLANAFSPDGKTIAAVYGHSMNASQEMGLVEINIETGAQREIMPDKFFHIKDVEWLPNKSGLFFSADKKIGETVKILQVDYNTGKVDSLTNDSINYATLSLNQNADLLTATIITADFHLFIQDAANPNSFKMLTQARDNFAFSPDGKIVYATDTAGNEDIWLMDADGANQRQLTNDKGLDTHPLVSPDNRYIFFTSNRTGESRIWRMNIDGSNQVQITNKNGGYSRFVTPDGKFLYYQSAMTDDLMKVSLEGGEESSFGENVGYFQAFSPDGNRLAFLFRDKETNKVKINVMLLETKEILKTFAVAEVNGSAYFLHWQNNETLAYSMDARNASDTIWAQNLNEEKPTLLHDLSDEQFWDIQFLPDGKKTAFIRGNWRHDALLLKGLK